MNLKLNLFSFLFACIFLVMTSCSSDDDSVGNDDFSAGCADFEEVYTNVLDKASEFSNNPTTENCENYKQSILNFYDSYSDCNLWKDEYEEGLEELKNMDCSEIAEAE